MITTLMNINLGFILGCMTAWNTEQANQTTALLAMFPTMDGFWIVAGLLMVIPLLTLAAKPLETKGKSLEDIQVERT